MLNRRHQLQIFLASVWLTHCCAVIEQSNTPGSHLDVTHFNLPGNDTVHLMSLTCTIDMKESGLAKLGDIIVTGSPCDDGEYDTLFTSHYIPGLDEDTFVGNQLKLVEDPTINITQDINTGDSTLFYVAITWKSLTPEKWNFYKCLYHGYDKTNEEIYGKRELKFGLGENCISHEMLVEKVENTHSMLSEFTQLLTKKINLMEQRLEKIEHTLNPQFMVAASTSAVSGLFRNHVYTVSNRVQKFNIEDTNNVCRAMGGYLLEIDDKEEYRFVYGFLKKTGGSDAFMTGANDIDEEGRFVFFNSDKQAPPFNVWATGQPDNYLGFEDCVEIRLSFHGINDIRCDAQRLFVCEVPRD